MKTAYDLDLQFFFVWLKPKFLIKRVKNLVYELFSNILTKQ